MDAVDKCGIIQRRWCFTLVPSLGPASLNPPHFGVNSRREPKLPQSAPNNYLTFHLFRSVLWFFPIKPSRVVTVG